MRGDDQQQDGVFSYVSLEQRVPAAHPLRCDPQDSGRGVARVVTAVRRAVRGGRAALDRTGEVAAGAVAAGAVRQAQ